MVFSSQAMRASGSILLYFAVTNQRFGSESKRLNEVSWLNSNLIFSRSCNCSTHSRETKLLRYTSRLTSCGYAQIHCKVVSWLWGITNDSICDVSIAMSLRELILLLFKNIFFSDVPTRSTLVTLLNDKSISVRSGKHERSTSTISTSLPWRSRLFTWLFCSSVRSQHTSGISVSHRFANERIWFSLANTPQNCSIGDWVSLISESEIASGQAHSIGSWGSDIWFVEHPINMHPTNNNHTIFFINLHHKKQK